MLLYLVLYTILHILFISANKWKTMSAFWKCNDNYNWTVLLIGFSYATNFVLPFMLLLTMNCFIIHTIRNRSMLKIARSSEGQGQDAGHNLAKRTQELRFTIVCNFASCDFLISDTHNTQLFMFSLF